MRGRPSNALVPVQIPAGAYRVVAKRVEPFALMYWNGRGFTTLDTCLCCAYIQGFEDAMQVAERESNRERESLDFQI